MDHKNPLLEKIELPGRRFRLPSRGQFYTNGELDPEVEDGEVQIFSMTAIDEISMRSPEYLFNGQAIERVFNRCVPEIKKPLELLSVDVDYILTAIRIVSYGDIIEINLRCPKCEEHQKSKNNKKLEELREDVAEKAEEQDFDFETAWSTPEVQEKVEAISNRTSQKHSYKINLNHIISNQTKEITEEDFKHYEFTLSNGQYLKMNPMRMSNAIAVLQTQNEDLVNDLNKAEDYVSFVIAATVQEIDGHSDKDDIIEWAKRIPIKLKEEISSKIGEQGEFGTNFEYNLECPECGDVRHSDALLNPITFFTIPSSREIKND